MTGWFWAGLLTGLAANECCDISEWTARRLVRWSARVRYGDPERAEVRAQELEAVVVDRPGQLLKLFTAVWFGVSAVRAWIGRAAAEGSVTGVRVSSAATIRATVATATVIVGVAALTQVAVVLDRPLPENLTSPSLRAAQSKVAHLESRVTSIEVTARGGRVAWEDCVAFGQCQGASGWDQIENGLVSSQRQLQVAVSRENAIEARLQRSEGLFLSTDLNLARSSTVSAGLFPIVCR